MNAAVLLVDDDENVLSSLRRQLGRRYRLSTACGGEEALKCVEREGPFAVVLSDMRMPNMDGVQFLSALAERSPNTVRMMLTGNNDQNTAIKAINEGKIFRFFSKPCPAEEVAKGIDAALDQHRLITAERELLEKTLAGSVKMFVDVLSLFDPTLFGQAQQRRNWMLHLAKKLRLPNQWQLGVAALLADLGAISVPFTTLTRLRQGYRLTDGEQKMVDEAPGTAKRLLAHIPRLEPVADIIYYQNKGYNGSGYPNDIVAGADLPLGARILKILNDLLKTTAASTPDAVAFKALAEHKYLYDQDLFLQIQDVFLKDKEGLAAVNPRRITEISVATLSPGMRAATDVVTKAGKLVVAAGQTLEPAQVVILKNLGSIQEISGTIKVLRSSGG